VRERLKKGKELQGPMGKIEEGFSRLEI